MQLMLVLVEKLEKFIRNPTLLKQSCIIYNTEFVSLKKGYGSQVVTDGKCPHHIPNHIYSPWEHILSF